MKTSVSFLLIGLLNLTSLQAQKSLDWTFPINRPHAGILLGNGTQGLMAWGQENQLIITVGRAGFWDHRGGNDFATRINYKSLQKLLVSKDNAAIREAFAVPKTESPVNLGHPQQLGGGRVVLTLPEDWYLKKGTLFLDEGKISIRAEKDAKIVEIVIRQAPLSELAFVNLPPELQASKVKIIPTWHFVGAQLQGGSIAPPEEWESEKGRSGGFVQRLPEDIPLAIAFRREANIVLLGSALSEEPKEELLTKLEEAKARDIIAQADKWWYSYWNSVPGIRLPDPVLQEIYDYGLYKQACTTAPQGVPCTLQGPFMESYQLPPWSNDYHFNINIEMIYYPALMSGRFEHFEPLWAMIESWQEEIQRNGQQFFGREKALMLPHAVDDRCKVVGTFWTGTIDHACTAWMAQLAWLHYAYSGDRKVLEKTAWPLLLGAFEGYWAMLEKEGTQYSLPVSVSPEYRGSRMDAWGKNASFQLAALHAICTILPKAAQALGEEADPRWEDVDKRLPPYTTFKGVFLKEWGVKNERIALWEGMDLIESHRHHSHLGSIWPFVTIDPLSDAHGEMVKNSLATWRYRGAGGWSGWCVPWAAILMSRTNQSEASINWLHYWKDNFTNEGRGTLHNANNNGHSYLGSPVWGKVDPDQEIREVMQLDAGFGALTAVFELLVQNRKDGLHVLPDIPLGWQAFSFENIWSEGGFQLSAEVQEGQIQSIQVKASRDGDLVLHHHMGEAVLAGGVKEDGQVLRRHLTAGENLILSRP